MKIKDILRKYREIKVNFMNFSPHQKWLLVENAEIYVLKSIDLNFLDLNFKVNWRSFLCYFLSVNIISVHFFTPFGIMLIWVRQLKNFQPFQCRLLLYR